VESSHVTHVDAPTGHRLTLGFYVGPRVEGAPESARSRAVIRLDNNAATLDVPAAEVDRMAREWLNARGQFNLEAFQAAMAAADDDQEAGA